LISKFKNSKETKQTFVVTEMKPQNRHGIPSMLGTARNILPHQHDSNTAPPAK